MHLDNPDYVVLRPLELVAGKILKVKGALNCCKPSLMGQSGGRLGELNVKLDAGRDLVHGVSEREDP